jgi:hypothetical protein
MLEILRCYVPSGEILYLIFANEDQRSPHVPHQALIVAWNVAEDQSVMCLIFPPGTWYMCLKEAGSEVFSQPFDTNPRAICFVLLPFYGVDLIMNLVLTGVVNDWRLISLASEIHPAKT